MRTLNFILYTLCLTSCVHTPAKNFESQLKAGQCEKAFTAVPELQRIEKTQQTASWLMKNTVAYTYVGLNYTAEVLWDASVGTAGFIALCLPLPIMAVMSDANNHRARTPLNFDQRVQPIGLSCLPEPDGIRNVVLSPPLGRNALSATENFRCPDVTPLALSLEKVGECHEKRNEIGDRDKAFKTYEAIANSSDFFSCVNAETRERIQKHVERLKVSSVVDR